MKQTIAAVLRSTGLMPIAERARFIYQRARLKADNARFMFEFPAFKIPTDELLYEISGNVDYRMHHRSGLKWAKRFWSHIQNLPGELAVLEWGCGVGRVIRHMPSMSQRVTRAIGTDYDPRMIEWCSKSIAGVEFLKNDLMPPINLPAHSIDAVICYSVFTHLSLEAHHAWVAEMARLLKPGGLFCFTTMSDACKRNLLPDEVERYDRGELVVRLDEREGSRLYAAYGNAAFIRSLLRDWEIVAHEPADVGAIAQDLWVVRVGHTIM